MFNNLTEVGAAFEIGIGVLATHPGCIQERRIEVFHWELHLIQPEDITGKGLDADAQAGWRQVVAAVTARRDEKRGSHEPSIEAMSDDEARRIAQMTTNVASMVSHAMRR